MAHQAVKKPHSLGTKKENNRTKQPSGKEPTDCTLSTPALFAMHYVTYI